MSGAITATVIAGTAAAGAGLLGASTATALAVGGLTASLASGFMASRAKPAEASAAAPEAQVASSENQALMARSQLLETAGGSAGSPLAPSMVGNNDKTIFGN